MRAAVLLCIYLRNGLELVTNMYSKLFHLMLHLTDVRRVMHKQLTPMFLVTQEQRDKEASDHATLDACSRTFLDTVAVSADG